jgi:hypothetical protein
MTLEVRCCCDARIMLGTLDIDSRKAHPGRRIRYVVFERPAMTLIDAEYANLAEPLRTVEVEVAELVGGPGVDGMIAIKTNHTPIEDLRLLPGFKEAHR